MNELETSVPGGPGTIFVVTRTSIYIVDCTVGHPFPAARIMIVEDDFKGPEAEEIVGLFLTLEKAVECGSAEDIKWADSRWESVTQATLSAVRVSWPSLPVRSFADLKKVRPMEWLELNQLPGLLRD